MHACITSYNTYALAPYDILSRCALKPQSSSLQLKPSPMQKKFFSECCVMVKGKDTGTSVSIVMYVRQRGSAGSEQVVGR